MIIRELFARLGLQVDKNSFSAADRLMTGIKAALAGIIAFKTVHFFENMVEQVSESADHFGKLAQRIGIAVEPLQQIAYAADLSDVSLEELTISMQHLARTAFAAQQGSEESAKIFKNLGVSTKDAHGKLRPADELLGDIAERFKTMPDGQRKTALAMELFGRSGSRMIPFLNEGREGLAEMRKEFVELGAQVDGDTAKAFEKFNDDQKRVKVALQGLKTQAVMALLPELQKLVDRMLSWVKANREAIKSKLAAALKVLIGAVKVLAKTLDLVLSILKFLGDHVELVVVAIGSLTTAMVILNGVAIATAVRMAIAWAAALLPFTLLLGLIAAIILIIQDLASQDSLIKEVFSGLKTVVKDWIVDVKNEFKEFFKWLGDQLIELPDKLSKRILDVPILGRISDPTGVFRRAAEREAAANPTRSVPTAGETAEAGANLSNIFNITVTGANGEQTAWEIRKEVQKALDAHARDLNP